MTSTCFQVLFSRKLVSLYILCWWLQRDKIHIRKRLPRHLKGIMAPNGQPCSKATSEKGNHGTLGLLRGSCSHDAWRRPAGKKAEAFQCHWLHGRQIGNIDLWFAYVCLYVCMYVSIYIYVYLNISIYIYIYIYTFLHCHMTSLPSMIYQYKLWYEMFLSYIYGVDIELHHVHMSDPCKCFRDNAAASLLPGFANTIQHLVDHPTQVGYTLR